MASSTVSSQCQIVMAPECWEARAGRSISNEAFRLRRTSSERSLQMTCDGCLDRCSSREPARYDQAQDEMRQLLEKGQIWNVRYDPQFLAAKKKKKKVQPGMFDEDFVPEEDASWRDLLSREQIAGFGKPSLENVSFASVRGMCISLPCAFAFTPQLAEYRSSFCHRPQFEAFATCRCEEPQHRGSPWRRSDN